MRECDDASVAVLYQDPRITCTDDEIVIRWYYLWGDKRIRYAEIHGAQRVELTPLHGKGRIWGSANLRYWASLDPGRPRKQMALILDLGKPVRPFITPDDVPAVERVITNRAGLNEIPFAGVGPMI
jgi:hypothetical protein